MKLVTFRHNDQIGIGCMIGATEISVFPAQTDCFNNMLALIDAGEAGLALAHVFAKQPQEVVALDKVELLAPLPKPRQMRDCYGFEQHVKQARAKRHLFGITGFPTDPTQVQLPDIWYQRPLYYKCNVHSIVGTDTDVIWPRYADTLDYELEFAIVTGKSGKNLCVEDAGDYIFGYCIYNDFSARDEQYREMAGGLGPAKSKDFDTGNVLGPWLVTKDEIDDPYHLTMRAWVNGQLWSEGNSATMYHRFESILALISAEETFQAGEVVASGTVGNGCGLEQGRFLKDGDMVELEVQGLGRLRNTVRKRASSYE